ncbi:MAG: NADH-quinone oxidoreductase subunit NuoB [Verrucomicrobia bacterium]|nr:NADH-quinone oxidoreductase subunit NuoB [Verrucomicrobiota bacterium]
MFETLRQSLKTGVVTTSYPLTPPEVSLRARGKPEIDWVNWRDARPAAAVCPTGAIECGDESAPNAARTTTLDLGKCVFCGLCAEADMAIRMTNQCELASVTREGLRLTAPANSSAAIANRQSPIADRQSAIRNPQSAINQSLLTSAATGRTGSVEAVGRQLQDRIQSVLGRSLHIREVDAGSCNGCEVEIHGLNSPVYDIERFGIHFVASPRHADMLLVTGPVTRNMELALRKTYDATPNPRLVVAVGACGCSGGIFGRNYATCGAVNTVIPVDVYIPGCPPIPHALLHGILLAIGRLKQVTVIKS